MDGDLQLNTVKRAYERWAPIYDFVYTGLTAEGRRLSVEAAEARGPRVLEVGVGTGLSLPEYAPTTRIHGIDLSVHMLQRAVDRVARAGISNVELLAVMDACRLGFPNASFDAVVAQFVLTLVPDPETALDEFARVLRPGGEIVLVNHIGAASGLRAKVESAVAPMVQRFGWRAEFPLSRIERWAARSGLARVVALRPVSPFGFFTVIRLERTSLAPADVAGSARAAA